MRLYSFVNGLYLNDKQHGIQTAHAVSDISLQANYRDTYFNWAEFHKTIVILNAKNLIGLKCITEDISWAIDTYNDIVPKDERLPYTSFYEDKESLGGIQTCFACILPEKIYNFVDDTIFSQNYSRSDLIFELRHDIVSGNYGAATVARLLYHTIRCYNLV